MTTTTTRPMFPMPEPHHFSDYGFDPQIDYFQVIEEARKHHTKRAEPTRPIDSVHFKLQKPISKEDARSKSKSKKRKWWWKSAIDFWKRSRPDTTREYRHCYGPVYVTESASGSGSRTPCRVASRPGSGPLTAAEVVGMDDFPYVCLRDLEVAGGHGISVSGPGPMPIYLVT